MARIKELTELIGGTPLLELSRLSKNTTRKHKLPNWNISIRRKCKRPYSPGNDRGCGNKRHLETRTGYH